MRNKLFICYRRDDAQSAVGRIESDLARFFPREQIFRDVGAVAVGRDWRREVDEAIARSAVMLVVIGRTWLERDAQGRRRLDDDQDVVRHEIATALAGGVAIVPVLIEDARMPDPAELPSELQRLSAIQARRMADEDWTHHLRRLVEDIEKTGMPRSAEEPEGPLASIGMRALYKRKVYERTIDGQPDAVFEAVVAVLATLKWTSLVSVDRAGRNARFVVAILRAPGKLLDTPQKTKARYVSVVTVDPLAEGGARVLLTLATSTLLVHAMAVGSMALLEKRLTRVLLENFERQHAGRSLIHEASLLPGVRGDMA